MNIRSYSVALLRTVSVFIALALFSGSLFGAQTARKRRHRRHRATAAKTVAAKRVSSVKSTSPIKRASYVQGSAAVRPASYGRRLSPAFPIVRGGPWTEPTFADSTVGDNIDGEDLDVRRAAVAALGSYNGSVVVVDPSNGRILSMVNQKLALGSGFQPCSTIKISVALAAMSEQLLTEKNGFHLFGRSGMNLTYALAHSNNYFFATLGTRMGFETFSRYAHTFGYGEKAGWNIPNELPGRFPSAPPQNGGVGMLTSFGEEISQTPLELAALMASLANGGTLYYLQYPRSQPEVQQFAPQIKRQLDIHALIPALKAGMRGAVAFGTARRAMQDEPIAGKTGTCTDSHTHLGWFGSFNDDDLGRKLVVVVLLTGGRPSIGPLAAGVAGEVYKNLAEVNYFAHGKPETAQAQPPATPNLLATEICCAR